MDSDKRVCPVCGQDVELVVQRHKTLGAWVPVWVPGPCRNPECEAYAGYGSESAESEERSGGHVAKNS